MATRIGGPMVGTTVPPPTWASMRWPIALNAFRWNATLTKFSRAWPSDGSTVPKFFKWESGSLFRNTPYGFSPVVPHFQLTVFYDPSPTMTFFTIGMAYSSLGQSVDNHDFQQLIGEALDTDIGTYTINQEAHNPNFPGQLIREGDPPGTEIYDIGKLTGF